MSDIWVSVLITTYNHERFIAQTLESALMQQTRFAYEILVGEDLSPDNTRAIVADFAKRFPDKIRPFYSETRLYGNRNFSRLLEASKGRYIAWLEGDDYWIDPHKLQKQVDFLEANPDFALCFHRVYKEYEDGSRIATHANQAWVTTMTDLCRGNYIETASVMYRKAFDTMPEWVIPLPLGDWPMHLLHAQHGKIGYLEDIMAVYRQHSQSTWSTTGLLNRVNTCITTAEACLQHLDKQYEPAIHIAMTRWHANIIEATWKTQVKTAWRSFLQILRFSCKQPTVFLKHWQRKKYYQRLKAQSLLSQPNCRI